MILNAAMFLVEWAAGAEVGSLSLQADALDFFADAANYAISLGVAGMSLVRRARAAQVKGLAMALFGIWVLGQALYRAYAGLPPEPYAMGAVALLALLANCTVAALLWRFRGGDANRRSAWICSRNDALGNLIVIAAAAAVGLTATRWPDLAVAGIMAALALQGAWSILRQAHGELRRASAS